MKRQGTRHYSNSNLKLENRNKNVAFVSACGHDMLKTVRKFLIQLLYEDNRLLETRFGFLTLCVLINIYEKLIIFHVRKMLCALFERTRSPKWQGVVKFCLIAKIIHKIMCVRIARGVLFF